MKAFWALFWAVAVVIGLIWVMNECEIYGWIRVPILGGAALGTAHTIYNYEEIACTCDDPDHEH